LEICFSELAFQPHPYDAAETFRIDNFTLPNDFNQSSAGKVHHLLLYWIQEPTPRIWLFISPFALAPQRSGDVYGRGRLGYSERIQNKFSNRVE
jgi:hypothetical protein